MAVSLYGVMLRLVGADGGPDGWTREVVCITELNIFDYFDLLPTEYNIKCLMHLPSYKEHTGILTLYA